MSIKYISIYLYNNDIGLAMGKRYVRWPNVVTMFAGYIQLDNCYSGIGDNTLPPS